MVRVPALVCLILAAAPLAACERGTATVSAPVETAAQPPAPPSALLPRLQALTLAFDGDVGLAVSDVEAGWTAEINGRRLYPQQSVAKLWVGLAVMDAIDRGALTLDQTVRVTRDDAGPFHQPILDGVSAKGRDFTVRDLLEAAITKSDNTADDVLMRTLGGAAAVQRTLDAKGVRVRVGAPQPELQSRIAGLAWKPEYAEGRRFQEARARLPDQTRQAALDAYLADPMDGATPLDTVRALGALHRGELLSPASTRYFLGVLGRTKTGPERLAKGLPAGWTLAHKTGTGQVWGSLATANNDVGLITAPDGRAYAVAVFIGQTRRPVPERLVFLQQVSAAIAEDGAGA